MRCRYVVDVTWSQPTDQAYVSDWGTVIGNAIQEEATALYEVQEGVVEVLGATERVSTGADLTQASWFAEEDAST